MNIFLTGATGFVGGELLVNLSKRKEVEKIYCLVRSPQGEEAMERLRHVFDLHGDFLDTRKIIPVSGDLFDESLTDSLVSDKRLSKIDVIIHSAANTSFAKIFDSLVEKANIEGLRKILLWAKRLPHLDTFLYVGTATICGKDIKDRVILEQESPNLKANHLVRYTYTKMTGEILLHEYLPEDKILIARPSIIMGDSRPWIPRSPVILWALATVNQLRMVPVNPHAQLDVIPVDYAVEAMVALLFSKKRHHHIYHVSSGLKGATTPLKLTQTVEDAFINDKPPFLFVQNSMLNQIKSWAKDKLKPNSSLLAYPEYIEYWNKTFQEASRLRILLAGMDPYFEFIKLGQVFDNSRLLKDTTMVNSIPADIYLKKSISFLDEIDVFEGAINP
jgi:thioester reductase-like protein